MKAIAKSFRLEFIWLLLLLVAFAAFEPMREIAEDQRYLDGVSECDEPPFDC